MLGSVASLSGSDRRGILMKPHCFSRVSSRFVSPLTSVSWSLISLSLVVLASLLGACTVESSDSPQAARSSTPEFTITFEAKTNALSIPENSAAGTSAGKLKASVDVKGGEVGFKLAENEWFELDHSTVRLKVGANLDYEATLSFEVAVTAESQDAASVTLTLPVTVTNVPENFITFAAAAQSLSIAEDASAGDSAGTLLGSTDGPGAISFSIAENDWFELDEATVKLKEGASLDYETASEHQLAITAQAEDAADIPLTLLVTVTNVPEKSITFAVTAQSLSIAEDASAGDSAGTLLASTDGPDSVSFSITENDWFELDEATVKLKEGATLDHELANSHQIVITAQAEDAASVTNVIGVVVENVLENTITFTVAAQSLSIAEDASADDSAGTLLASTDGPGAVSLSIAENDLFELDEAAVKLKSSATLDYELAASHSITVTATAYDSAEVTRTLSVAVTDVAEYVISFVAAAQRLSIAEDASPGSSVGTLLASTDGSGAVVSFSMPSHDDFELDGATVKLKSGASLNYEETILHVIRVTASAPDLLDVTRSLQVRVVPSVQDGTADNPYRVDTLTKLQSIASGFINTYVANHCATIDSLSGSTCTGGTLDLATSLSSHYVVTTNIDASSTSSGAGFLPIGECSTNDCSTSSGHKAFTGNFDGQGFTISGLAINRPTMSGVGLFAVLGETGTITDLVLDGSKVKGRKQVGALVGHNDGGSVTDITASGEVHGSADVGGLVGYNHGGIIGRGESSGVVGGLPSQANERIGGMVGVNNEGTVRSSVASSDVSGSTAIGGLVGQNLQASTTPNSTITDSTASGDVQGASSEIGGLVGTNQGTVSDSTASGDVSGSATSGGLVGSTSGTVSNSEASGHVTTSGNQAGGLAGYNSGEISRSRALGNVKGSDYVGGLVGHSHHGSTVSNGTASGAVSGSAYIGGLAGYLEQGTVTDSFATGKVLGTSSYIGGLVGDVRSGGTVKNSFATGTVTGSVGVGGLVGLLLRSTLQDSFATGDTKKVGNSGGGLVGLVEVGGKVSRSFAVGNADGNSNIGGLVGYTRSGSTVEDVYQILGTARGGVGGTGIGALVGGNDGTVRRGYCPSGGGRDDCVGIGTLASEITRLTEKQLQQLTCSDAVFDDCSTNWNTGASTELPVPQAALLSPAAFKDLEGSDFASLDATNPGTGELGLDASGVITKQASLDVLSYAWQLPDGVTLAEEDLLSDVSIAVTVADPAAAYTLHLTIVEFYSLGGSIVRVYTDEVVIDAP